MNRYDFMESSKIMDDLTGNCYPDPLSLTYFDLKPTEQPVMKVVSPNSGLHFWKDVAEVYGDASPRDIILTVNNIAHKNFLQPGDTLYYPTLNDIQKSYRKK